MSEPTFTITRQEAVRVVSRHPRGQTLTANSATPFCGYPPKANRPAAGAAGGLEGRGAAF